MVTTHGLWWNSIFELPIKRVNKWTNITCNILIANGNLGHICRPHLKGISSKFWGLAKNFDFDIKIVPENLSRIKDWGLSHVLSIFPIAGMHWQEVVSLLAPWSQQFLWLPGHAEGVIREFLCAIWRFLWLMPVATEWWCLIPQLGWHCKLFVLILNKILISSSRLRSVSANAHSSILEVVPIPATNKSCYIIVICWPIR